jgi:hypothetical protein
MTFNLSKHTRKNGCSIYVLQGVCHTVRLLSRKTLLSGPHTDMARNYWPLSFENDIQNITMHLYWKVTFYDYYLCIDTATVYTLMLISYCPSPSYSTSNVSCYRACHVNCHGPHLDSTIAFVLLFDLDNCYDLRATLCHLE